MGSWSPPLWLAIAWLGVAQVFACSLLLDGDTAQCHNDQDCARYSHAVCNTKTLLCAPFGTIGATGGASGSKSGGGGGTSGGGLVGWGGNGVGSSAGAAGGGLTCRTPAGGCVPCLQAPDLGPINSCTDVACVPFDNFARLQIQGASGGLRPLP